MYYYNSVTRETSWTKPLELASDEERRARESEDAAKRSFFKDMEENMRKNMRKAASAPEPTSTTRTVGEGVAEGKSGDAHPRTVPVQLLQESQRSKGGSRVRTISTVDDSFLEMAKRSESFGSPSQRRKESLEGASLLDLDPSARSASGGSAKVGFKAAPQIPQSRDRRNSSSTIFVESTLSSPDKQATIKCVCTVIRAHILETHFDSSVSEHPKAAVFHDFTPSGSATGRATVPTLAEINHFFQVYKFSMIYSSASLLTFK